MLPADHATRMERARVALTGLSVGDAFGDSVTPCAIEVCPLPIANRAGTASNVVATARAVDSDSISIMDRLRRS